ncbi:hypothetical protein PVK06_024551 [Gossypium arboreum]|uniref:DUF7745 domain-containing protein n=1 Tax=Gossypium arboreum TaxID=29729 RepID=A0ABR0PE70_GOSAR|nr:hypothetical protein PVK06_024551 [Gossypium arboreum]
MKTPEAFGIGQKVRTSTSGSSHGLLSHVSLLLRTAESAQEYTRRRKKLQSEKGDSLVEGYTSELQNFTRINVTQNELQELKDIWARWDEGTKQLFYQSYGDIPYLLDVKVDKRSFRGMSESWVTAQIQQKGDSKCIPWENLRDLVLTHPDEKKRVDIFALSIYGLVIFPKALRHVDEVVTDLFDRLEKGVTPVPTILAETFRSLSMCQRIGEGRFIGCAQLLMV